MAIRSLSDNRAPSASSEPCLRHCWRLCAGPKEINLVFLDHGSFCKFRSVYYS